MNIQSIIKEQSLMDITDLLTIDFDYLENTINEPQLMAIENI